MKKVKKVLGFVLIFMLVFGSTTSIYAASGSVDYRYTGDHVFVLSENASPIVVGSFGVSVKLGAEFFYNASDTQSRSYNKEEWYFIVDSNNRPTAKSESTSSTGDLKVYPINASVKTCTKQYSPNILKDPNWVYFYEAGCNKNIKVLKKGGNSYAELAYQIAVPKHYLFGASKVVKFNNLGTATGRIELKNSNDINQNSKEIPDIEIVDKDKPTEEEIKAASIAIKARMESKTKNQPNKEYQAILDFAEKNGLCVSNKEVEQCIEKVIELYQNADNMKEVKLACEMAGTTYEEFVKADFEGYKMLLTEKKVYEDFLKKHDKLSLFYGTMTNDQIETQVSLEWEAFKQKLINEG